MKMNIGKIDKIVRLLVAFTIAISGIYFNSWWGLFAIIPLLTGLVSFCPLYTLAGITTSKVERLL
jgi:hypothetical protein